MLACLTWLLTGAVDAAPDRCGGGTVAWEALPEEGFARIAAFDTHGNIVTRFEGSPVVVLQLSGVPVKTLEPPNLDRVPRPTGKLSILVKLRTAGPTGEWICGTLLPHQVPP